MDLDQLDRRLLNLMQDSFPLASRPFAVLAEPLGISEGEALERARRLKAAKLLRQVSAIFDSQALGYRSTLAAFQAMPDRLEQVASSLNQVAGISHNYARNHPYNLWFTLTVPPGQDPQDQVQRLARENGVDRFLYLPTLRVFKVSVQFDMVGMAGQSQPQKLVAQPPVPDHNGLDPALVRQLQEDLELTLQPFLPLAQALGLSEEALLRRARDLQDRGVMRRFAAVLHHRQAGFTSNAMVVWAVPTKQVEEVGKAIASFNQVTHCYQRPSYPEWPYSLFSMVHSPTPEGCRQIAAEISEGIGIKEFDLLFSTKEYKKTRVKYF